MRENNSRTGAMSVHLQFRAVSCTPARPITHVRRVRGCHLLKVRAQGIVRRLEAPDVLGSVHAQVLEPFDLASVLVLDLSTHPVLDLPTQLFGLPVLDPHRLLEDSVLLVDFRQLGALLRAERAQRLELIRLHLELVVLLQAVLLDLLTQPLHLAILPLLHEVHVPLRIHRHIKVLISTLLHPATLGTAQLLRLLLAHFGRCRPVQLL
mmetsp:Transcript_9924/g.20923  ORF Transcript_9924/g.20923 Transcript_9924/m.20923 type:complete len:208 (+) Transcript_9924:63-686(+)